VQRGLQGRTARRPPLLGLGDRLVQPVQLGHDLVQELVDLVHVVAAPAAVEGLLLDRLRREQRRIRRRALPKMLLEARCVVGDPSEEVVDLVHAVTASDLFEGFARNGLRGEPKVGIHGPISLAAPIPR
jgi:hypothetical protein